MKRQNKSEIIIFETKIQTYEVFFAFVFYSITLYLLHYLSDLWCLYSKNNIGSNYLLRDIILVFALMIYCLFVALDFSRKKSIIINTRSKTITSRYSVWSLNFDKRKRATDFEYVAYFEKEKNRIYGVNLWYKENRYFEIGEFDDLISAKNAAYDIARTLKIDLLDATENGNQKWIDVEV